MRGSACVSILHSHVSVLQSMGLAQELTACLKHHDPFRIILQLVGRSP